MPDIIAQRLVDLRLISMAFPLRFVPEPFQYIRINKDGDPCLAFIGYHGSKFSLAEVVFLRHLILSLHKPSAPLGLPSVLQLT